MNAAPLRSVVTACLRTAVVLAALAWPASVWAQADSQPAPPPESQPNSQPATRPGSQPVTQPVTRPVTQPASRPATAPASQPASAPATQSTSAPASAPATSKPTTTTQAVKSKDHYLAVTNGRVHTVSGPVLERATVLAKDTAILAIGTSVQLPPDCQVVDAAGLEVYPGLIAAAANGIHGGDLPQDGTNVYGLSMQLALAAGITTSLSGNNAAKMTFGTTDDMLLKPNIFVGLSYTTRNPLERAQLRADLDRVRTYLRDVQKFEREKATKKDAKPPDKEWLKDKYENYRRLLAHETAGVLTAQNAQELQAATELAQEYSFDLVVRGAYEGWQVAPALGRAGVSAIITPREEHNPDERLNRPTGSTIENARVLHDHGVKVAVVPLTPSISLSGLAGRDLLHLAMEAAFAVRGGLSNEAALRTITIEPARILGIDDRVGSLEVGKDADLVICDGDLLHYMTQVRYTIVNGRLVYDKSKSTLFAHIRPTGQPEVPQFDDQWPRQLEWRE